MEQPAHLSQNPQTEVSSPQAHDSRGFWHPGSLVALLRGRALVGITAVLAILFIAITIVVLRDFPNPIPWDVQITHEIQELPSPVGGLLADVSGPGFTPWNVIITGAIVLFMVLMRWYTEAVFVVLAGVGGASAEGIKLLINRPRPDPNVVHVSSVLNSYSFPSGHVTYYVAFLGLLFYLAYTLLPHKGFFDGVRWAILLLNGAAILLIGPSRVYMGQHWASDTLGGYALGFTWLLIVIQLYRAWMQRHPKEPRGVLPAVAVRRP